ncbi:MAG: aminoacetone oxidase family FAD-binding enzyme, partial [Chloroflexi bacterium]|nr:aminoacetone oxidase family FAD-binding enzyme [Chloroflexota bacterium]
MNKYDVIVVGGGPAGMMAAGQTSILNNKTLLIEKMNRPGRKLLLTGKHRCNLTNMASIEEALGEFNREGRFLTQLFYRFYNNDLRTFFLEIGIPTVEQRGGRVFPESEKARDIVKALNDWIIKTGVEIKTGASVNELIIYADQVKGVITSEGDFMADAVILATGGKAYPGTGSTGDGYRLARLASHKFKPLRPALVPLVTAGNAAKSLQGLS